MVLFRGNVSHFNGGEVKTKAFGTSKRFVANDANRQELSAPIINAHVGSAFPISCFNLSDQFLDLFFEFIFVRPIEQVIYLPDVDVFNFNRGCFVISLVPPLSKGCQKSNDSTNDGRRIFDDHLDHGRVEQIMRAERLVNRFVGVCPLYALELLDLFGERSNAVYAFLFR